MIVVFDGDIFEEKVLDYDELVAEGEKNNILAVSNPAFELFLLLHYENSYEDDIEPNAEQIIQNEKDGHQTFIYKLLLARTAFLQEKMGISLAETKKTGLDSFYYLEQYDSYYLIMGDSNFDWCMVTSGTWESNNKLILKYVLSFIL